MRKLDKHTARASAARVEWAAPDSKDTAIFLRRARAASLKAMGSGLGALAEEEYHPPVSAISTAMKRGPHNRSVAPLGHRSDGLAKPLKTPCR